MPRYLRWIAACTAGITIQFAFFVAVGAIALGTGNKSLNGFIGAFVTFASSLVTMIASLGVNDWLRTRYPIEPRVRIDGQPAEDRRIDGQPAEDRR